ncbi:hypothetical protein SNEBB_009378 [Seison nebaliae]|nr:hypothetical protein SNEBB_009378 [Seison nebaliae]
MTDNLEKKFMFLGSLGVNYPRHSHNYDDTSSEMFSTESDGLNDMNDELISDNDKEISDSRLYDINAWDTTILGRQYQEHFMYERTRRKQPGYINSDKFSVWSKDEQAPGGLFGFLEINDIAKVEQIKKPDMLQKHHNKTKQLSTEKRKKSIPKEKIPMIFDEKTLFPKYLLEYEGNCSKSKI